MKNFPDVSSDVDGEPEPIIPDGLSAEPELEIPKEELSTLPLPLPPSAVEPETTSEPELPEGPPSPSAAEAEPEPEQDLEPAPEVVPELELDTEQK